MRRRANQVDFPEPGRPAARTIVDSGLRSADFDFGLLTLGFGLDKVLFGFQDAPGDPPAPCKYSQKHVEVTLQDTHTVDIEPRCSMLFYSMDSTTLGRILGASRAPGHFTEPEVFQNYINNGGLLTHKRVRYEPDAAVAHDMRVFALVAAPSADELPVATLTQVVCGNVADACFELILDGAVTAIHFSWDGQRHVLSSVTLP